MMLIKDIIQDLEEVAPPRLAESWDKIGLQVGSPDANVSKIAVALDPTSAVIETAIETGAELLICHHPLIFSPLDTVTSGSPVADSIIKLITSGTALYVMHTNYDSVEGGVNDVLAKKLGVTVTGLLAPTKRERKFKVVVFVPEESVDEVRDAMADAGAGIIGHYTHCSFRTQGIGTFVPLPAANPYMGDIGELEEAPEFRLEMVVPEWKLGAVLDAMIMKHPYEEVAYDVYALENEPEKYGYGRVGHLKHAVKLSEFRKMVEESLGYTETRMIGDPERPVEIVALCSGSGKSLAQAAANSGANVYVCGDMGHHDFLNADALGLAVIDAGHYHTEFPAMEALADLLCRKYAGENITVELLR